MSKLSYTLLAVGQNTLVVGGTRLDPGVPRTVIIEEDSPDDLAISAGVTAGQLVVQSVTAVAGTSSPGVQDAYARNRVTIQPLSYAATITPDMSTGSIVNITLTGAMTVAAPTNPQFVGQRLTFNFIQGGAGTFVTTWNAIFKKAADGAAGATGTAASKDFVWNGTNWVQQGGALAYL